VQAAIVNTEACRDKMSVDICKIRAEDFGDILKINAESSPNVAKLDDGELRRLAALASIALVATDSRHVVGYVLGIASSDVYEGEEFQAFQAILDEPFLYVDQVAVCANARGANIASQMYAHLQQRSHELGIHILCCEVNRRPANLVSMEFHRKLGFESIGEMETRDGRSVFLLRKETPPVSRASARSTM
jgi:predicted GNAT superfamily acetyltransferase